VRGSFVARGVEAGLVWRPARWRRATRGRQ